MDFDSAAAHAGGNDTVTMLAHLGLSRAQLDRGQFVAAAANANGVPTGFVYNAALGGAGEGNPSWMTFYSFQTSFYGCGWVNIGDRKGGNGLAYVSANDPRLVVSTSVALTCDGLYGGSANGSWSYPTKFGNPATGIPLATGIEARLVEAEGALQNNQIGAWAAVLRALRVDTADTHVAFAAADSIPADSAESASHDAQVDLLFRERAFWLFGTGMRLSDLRRLVRQYGRNQATVFPTGAYPSASDPHLPSPLPNYGTDVTLTLPTPSGGLTDPNPAYKGCIATTTTA